MARARVVAVGEATSRAILLAGGPLSVVAEGTGEDALRHFLRSGAPCFVGAARPAPALSVAIAAGQVTHWPVYDRRVPWDVGACCAAAGALDLVTLTSPSAARTWAKHGDRTVPCAVIGPTTAAAAGEAGLEVVVQARVPSMEALARAARSVVSDK
jgi:uroporphyrinogen-III synthase